ncbi:MAG: stage II sporulation protein R [Firmicutes bacterium]|nr:stage II sporulation protein R [Bacillota bacterium]
MKIAISIFFIIGIIAIVAFGLPLGGGDNTNTEFLRLHIRANSNSQEDQAIKHVIRQEVIDAFTPIFSTVTSRDQAMTVLGTSLSTFEDVANRVLSDNGFDYRARASLRNEHFPTRSYNGFVLTEGFYDALIIELGSGSGDNWWCVIYPPLCFLNNNIGGERGVVYRSRLQEIIRRLT